MSWFSFGKRGMAALEAEVNAVRKYRKRPVVIEAIRWDGTEECLSVVLAWTDFDALPDDGIHVGRGIGYVPALGTLDIPTLEGTMTASPGDWIIKGVQGEFYPCKPDIFAATYESASNQEREPE